MAIDRLQVHDVAVLADDRLEKNDALDARLFCKLLMDGLNLIDQGRFAATLSPTRMREAVAAAESFRQMLSTLPLPSADNLIQNAKYESSLWSAAMVSAILELVSRPPT